jgi:cyanate permease
MLALLWLIYVSFGLAVGSMAPLVTPIVADLKMSYSQVGLILGSWQLVYIFASIGAGNIIDRWGERKSLLVGAVLIGLSISLRSLSQGFGTMLPAVALLGVGGPMISVGGPKTISLWFNGRLRGTALGVFMTGSTTGIFLGFALTNSVVMPLTDFSWRTVFLCYGIFAFISTVLWGFMAREMKPDTTTQRTGVIKVLGQIVRIRNVQLVLIMGLLSFATSHGMMNWLPKILETGGMSPTLAGFAASANILAGVPAVLIFPRAIPQHFRSRFLALSALVAAISLCVLIFTSGVLQFGALMVMGIAGAVFIPILMLILMENAGISTDYLGSAGGVFFCVAEIGGFLAPLLMGALYDMTNGFLTGILLLTALNILIMPVAFRLKTRASNQIDNRQKESGLKTGKVIERAKN